MKYYAHYGHKQFILCLGHGAGAIKNFFLKYDECQANDFVYSEGGRDIRILNKDIHDWQITFVDTGLDSSIGERLRKVRPYIEPDDVFLANYADGLSDLNLKEYVDSFLARDKTACFLSVPAPHTFHIVHSDQENQVTKLEHVASSTVRINAGYFVLKSTIFDYMNPGEELVIEPFERLIQKRQLLTVPYDGFWRNMDTFKDKVQLDELMARGRSPWKVWS
jgi:glucose-1-phosphate cytidylyltransferase